MTRFLRLMAPLAAALIASWPALSSAQSEYPNRPVKLVVGWSGTVRGEFTETDPEYHAFVYGNGRMRDLGRAGDNSSAWAINDRGAVAGLSHAEGVWIGAGTTAKSLGFQGTPYDINQFGVIAGTCGLTTSRYGVIATSEIGVKSVTGL